MIKELEILKTTIEIGIKNPVKLLQITDSHITRDEPEGSVRECIFENAEEYLLAALKYAKENNLTVLHTGDVFDHISAGNFDFFKKAFSDIDYIYAAGNHDFCHFVGRADETYEYKCMQLKKVAPHIKNNLFFYSRIIGGVNIVTLDNSFYLISEGQLELLRAEVAKGYPMILAMHIPIYGENLAKDRLDRGDPCAYVVGAPEELLVNYPEDRKLQQTPDSATIKAIEYIKNEPLIKALITGHNHINFEENITDTLVQYTTHGSFAGYIREITII